MKQLAFVIVSIIAFSAKIYGATLIAPIDNAKLTETNPEFSWSVDKDVERTEIQISKDNFFGNIFRNDTVYGFVNRFVPREELPAGCYWWRIRSKLKTKETWEAWGNSRHLKIQNSIHIIHISENDKITDICSAISSCDNNTRIVFPRGQTYTISSTDVPPVAGNSDEDNYLINLSARSNVIVDGNGCTIEFLKDLTKKPTNFGFTQIKGCSNVTIKNFSIKHNNIYSLPLKITSVDRDTNTFICTKFDQNYPSPNADDFQYKGDQGFVLDRDTHKIKFGTPLTLRGVPLGLVVDNDHWKYKLDTSSAAYSSNLRTGDIYLKCDKPGKCKVINAIGDVNLTISNIDTTNSGLTFHLYANRCANVNVFNCTWSRGEHGFMGPISDGMHFVDVRGGVWIEGNRIEANGDDAIAMLPGIHSFTRIDDKTINITDSASINSVAKSEHIKVGDVLHFFKKSTREYPTELYVKSITQKGTIKTLELSGKIDENLKYYCNYNLAAPGTVIRGNELIGCRGDAFHLTLDGAIIEGNTVTDIGERAFTFTPTDGGGSYSRNIMINNNTFTNIRRFAAEYTFGTFLMIKHGNLHEKLHNNIHFVDNNCSGYPDCALQIGQAKDIHILRNRFSSGQYIGHADSDNSIVLLDDADNVIIQENSFEEFRIRGTKDNNKHLSKADSEKAPEKDPKKEFSSFYQNNSHFDEQFYVNPWTLSKINHTEDKCTMMKGVSNPARSYTKFRLIGGGRMDLYSPTDKCTFEHVYAEKDCELKMKVCELNTPDNINDAKGGLMLRENLNPESVFAFIGIKVNNGNYILQFLYRMGTRGPLIRGQEIKLEKLPVYLSIMRSGNSFTGEYSFDDNKWNKLDSTTISMSDSIFAGVAVTSQAAGQLTTLDGDELSVSDIVPIK